MSQLTAHRRTTPGAPNVGTFTYDFHSNVDGRGQVLPWGGAWAGRYDELYLRIEAHNHYKTNTQSGGRFYLMGEDGSAPQGAAPLCSDDDGSSFSNRELLWYYSDPTPTPTPEPTASNPSGGPSPTKSPSIASDTTTATLTTKAYMGAELNFDTLVVTTSVSGEFTLWTDEDDEPLGSMRLVDKFDINDPVEIEVGDSTFADDGSGNDDGGGNVDGAIAGGAAAAALVIIGACVLAYTRHKNASRRSAMESFTTKGTTATEMPPSATGNPLHDKEDAIETGVTDDSASQSDSQSGSQPASEADDKS